MFHYDPGRESVPTYNREEAAEKFLSTLQKTKIETFDVEKNFIPEECHILQADCEEILDIIVEARKIQGKPIVTIMADRGQGFFQICEWIFPPKYNPELDRGLDENHRDNAGWGPLHYASFEGHSIIVKLLGNAGAELDMLDCDGKTGLHLACSEAHYDVVVQLLRSGANVNIVNLQVCLNRW